MSRGEIRRGECLPTRCPAKTDVFLRTGQYGYLGPGGPPPTVEDFSNYCRLRYPGSRE